MSDLNLNPNGPKLPARRAVFGRIASAVLAALLVFGSRAPMAAQSGANGQKPAGPTKTRNRRGKSTVPLTIVVVFPVDTKGGASDQVADVITDVERSRLNTTERYDPFTFVRGLPSIQRALSTQTLNPEDVQSPFDNTAKLIRLMGVLNYPMALVSSIDAYQYDADTQQMTFILSGRLVDFSGQKPRVIRQVTVTGETPKNLPHPAREGLVAELVARDATEKLMSDLLVPPKPAAPEKPAGGQAGAGGANAAK